MHVTQDGDSALTLAARHGHTDDVVVVELVKRGANLDLQNKVYKWKNHFSEMKGDVGMSHHEKEGEQEDAYTKTETHS